MEGIVLKYILHESSKNRVVAKKIKIFPGTDGALSNLSEILNMTLQFLNENTEKSIPIYIVDDDTTDEKKIKGILYTILNDSLEGKFKIDMIPSFWLTENKTKSSDIALLILFNIMQYTPQSLAKFLSSGSFLLTFAEPKNESLVLKMLYSAGFGLVLKKYFLDDRVALLLRQKQYVNKTTILNINDNQNWSNQIRTIVRLKDCDRLIIVVRSQEYSNLGQNLVVLQEDEYGDKIQIVDIQDPHVSKFSLEDAFYSSQIDLNLKMNILLPGKVWGTYKHFPITLNLQRILNWRAEQLNPSELESISWVEGFPRKVGDTIKVEYSAVNQADILLATAKLALEDIENRLGMNLFGEEYSGINSKGNRVMGIANGTFSNYITADTNYTWKIPDNWSLEDGATVPLAYAVAYLALVIKADVQKNQSVFVYDSASSIGQAAINVALNIKSQVFVGYVNDIDKENLKSSFSNIHENHFINASRNFADQIMAHTQGRGANLVIYNGDDLSKIDTFLMCVKNKGNVIVIGNLQDTFSKSVGMRNFLRYTSVFSINPTKINNLDVATKRKLSLMIENGIAEQTIKPLPRRTYSRDMLKTAFIDGASNNVFGKIIVKVQPEDGSDEALTIPRFFCKSEGSYLIIEGLSDFGLELIEFLVVRGAKNIIIASESKNTRAYSEHRINLWRQYGVSVVVRDKMDFTHQENGNDLLEEVSTVDAIFDLQRIDNLSASTSNSKYLFTKYIFEESKQICPDLRHFVVFSTCKNVKENVDEILLREIGLMKICTEKSKVDTPGLLIFLGPVSEIVKSTTENERNVPLLSIRSVIEQMDNLIGSKASIVSVSHKSFKYDSEKVKKVNDTTEETARSKFDKYISEDQSISTTWRLQILDEK
ncbi:fatty acid synthase-like [Leptopilina boulardi]|uniref:fatty acid synthase-like n=1 Tax=Leptopilina boulardi TaxID=63433 RepID=UPI0021F60E29|nr:fatty acid synthase-like [Leptopilina boulardi]